MQVLVKYQYGIVRYYPNCEKSRIIASMLGTKTLTADNLQSLARLGYQIVKTHEDV